MVIVVPENTKAARLPRYLDVGGIVLTRASLSYLTMPGARVSWFPRAPYALLVAEKTGLGTVELVPYKLSSPPRDIQEFLTGLEKRLEGHWWVLRARQTIYGGRKS